MKTLRDYLKQTLLLFFASICLAIIITIYAGAFEFGVEVYQKIYHSKFFYLSTFLIAGSSILCTKWLTGARGSGHDLGEKFFEDFEQDSPIINQTHAKYFSEKTIIAKIISSILAIFGGAALGKEGPLVHIGMSVLASFKKRIPSFHIPLANTLPIGTCIGFAAAFRDPIIGIVYMLEMFGIQKGKKYFIQNIIMLLGAICIAKYILENLLHIPPIVFHLPEQEAIKLQILVRDMKISHAAVLILIASICGAVSSHIINAVRYYGSSYFQKLSNKMLIFIPILAGVFITLFAYFVSVEVLGPGNHLLHNIFHIKAITALDFIGKYLNCLLSMIIGCAGGIVIPALTLGAMFGAILDNTLLSPPTFMTIICAASFLAPTIHAPLTAAVLVIIFTQLGIQIALYILIAAYISHMMAKLIKTSYA